ncbi:hypothetical protein [Natrialba taiwanensis]|uniref:Uncharacterized protein n=1 Tax=Natrialba taiwanensis DSM 12281 TaxID=1230458 RepID=M0A0X0_9EURY|nr:hypothetical protein [Natrialba taiwanensis]ELY91482.1 hypothetical protein C484_10656 [Natrialba taiwanensis DSM 12281]
MPWLTNSNETAPKLPDGEPADVVYVNGVEVYVAEIPIDIFDRSSLGYYIGDTGQATLPQIVSNEGYDNPDAVWLPYDNPNDASNLASDNSGYDSSMQDVDLENYLRTGQIAEIYLRPATWGSNSQFRFSFLCDGYYPSNHIRLRFTDGYWRIEQGSTVYGGTGDAESFTGFNDNGNYHRVVVDLSQFPYIECHLWDAGTGNFISTISGEDSSPDTDEAGHQFWFNSVTEIYGSDYRIIDSDDFTAGQDM